MEQIEAYGGGGNVTLTTGGEAERIVGTTVTAGLLDMLGVQPALGRNFTPEEDRPGAPPAVILGYRLWQRRFGGSSDVIGKQIELDGVGRTVVGVLPASFAFPDNNFGQELLLPMGSRSNLGWRERDFRILRVLARLKPGVTLEALHAEFVELVRRTASEEPPQFVTMRKDMEIRLIPLRQWLTGGVSRALLVLQAAVAMVLLIGCLNVANLQIARGIAQAQGNGASDRARRRARTHYPPVAHGKSAAEFARRRGGLGAGIWGVESDSVLPAGQSSLGRHHPDRPGSAGVYAGDRDRCPES